MRTYRPLASLLLLLVTLGAAAGCAPTPRVLNAPEASSAAAAPALAHENLHAVLWMQTATEYAALATQTYRQATQQLDAALADAQWTAAVEQAGTDGYADRPPAVVLDVDETVLDNSAYQARLVAQGGVYERDSWQAWVEEEAATAVPGALAFTRAAHARGVTVIYLTNRRSNVEEATRRNLAALGFPLRDDVDVILTRGEVPGWSSGDKTPRREAVAADYRVLMLLGDNLGDFLGDVEASPTERAALTVPYDAYWGTRWFMLPNPSYGSWEGALFDYDYSLTPAQRTTRKMDALRQ